MHTWGAWTWEDELCRETLAWVSPRSLPAAALTHQLGMIAELRGDYDGAERRYQDSLTIEEEIGDRAGVASTLSQLGVLRTERDQVADAVRYNLTAFAIRAEINPSECHKDLYWLGRQRRALGDREFLQNLREHLDEESVKVVLDLLDQLPDANL